MFCSQCGQNNKDENKFCSKCGFKLEDSSLQMSSEESLAKELQESQSLNEKIKPHKLGTMLVSSIALVVLVVAALATWRFAGPKLVSAVGGETPQFIKTNVGNLMGNINSGGLCDADGEWLYCNMFDKLYKMRLDGTEKTKLTDENAMYINACDGWVYFYDNAGYDEGGDIYRIKTDGTNKQRIVNLEEYESCNLLWVSDGKVYYDIASGLKYGALNRMNLDGSQKEEIAGHSIEDLYISDGWVYLGIGSVIPPDDPDYGGYCLYKLRLDGTGEVELPAARPELDPLLWYRQQMYKDNFYVPSEFANNVSYLYRIDLDMRNKVKIAEMKSDLPEDYTNEKIVFNVANDFVYYMSGSSLYNVKLDGSNNRKIGDIGYCHSINVFGDWIIGSQKAVVGDSLTETFHYVRIKDDGTEMLYLNSF